jgi:3-methylfumaryl-CoA hydratase
MDDVHEVTELITPGPAQALAGLLGVPPAEGELPLLWHWVYLLDRPPQDALGPDGHQHRGGMPVPPGPGLRRMFAGGRVWRHGELRIGSEATRRTWQASSVRKQGRSGPLHFFTVRTEVSQGGQVVVTEEQDLVVAPLYEDQGLIVSAAQDGDAIRVSCRDAADRVTASGVIS